MSVEASDLERHRQELAEQLNARLREMQDLPERRRMSAEPFGLERHRQEQAELDARFREIREKLSDSLSAWRHEC